MDYVSSNSRKVSLSHPPRILPRLKGFNSQLTVRVGYVSDGYIDYTEHVQCVQNQSES